MPIQFEEVTGQIDRSGSSSGGSSPTAPTSAPTEDFETQLERTLRIRMERTDRVSAD